MAFSVQLTSAAINDLNDAIQYYERKAEGLGKKFSEDLNHSFRSMSLYPEAFG